MQVIKTVKIRVHSQLAHSYDYVHNCLCLFLREIAIAFIFDIERRE